MRDRLLEEVGCAQGARQVRGFPEDSKKVIGLKQEVANLGDLAGRLKTDLPMQVDPLRVERPVVRAEDLLTALARAKSELDVTTAEIARLENQLVALNRKNDDAPTARQKYLEITGKIRDQEIEGGRWKTRLNEIQMALEAEIAKRRTHLESVQTAQVQFVPSSPKLTMILAFACFGGLAFGGGVVFLLHLLDRSVSTTEEAAHYFKVPIHGVIGEMVTRKRRLRQKIRRYLVEPAVALLILGALSIAMLDIGLKLKSPERYQEWRSAPVKFVFDHVTTTSEEARRQAGS